MRRAEADATVALAVPWRGEGERRLFVELIGQQFWMIGSDIRRPQGNWLIEVGFERYRAPDAVAGSSCYVAPAADPLGVHLWGFGCAWRCSAGDYAFLARCDPEPRWLEDARELERLHTIGDVEKRCRHGSEVCWWTNVADLLEWFSRYERCAQNMPGAADRIAALAVRQRRPICAVAELPERWLRWAARLRSNGSGELPSGGLSSRPDDWSDGGRG